MGDRDRFAGGDQTYLREVQYADSSKLAARASLHALYGRGDWFPWWARHAGTAAWPAGAEVLEVGCGAGWLWVQAAADLPPDLALTLTDQSSGMVAEALANVGAAGRYREVDGRTADAQALPFADDSFDVVVANHMLYHLPDPSRGVAELARVLRPEGVALVATNGHGHLGELWDIGAEVFPSLTAGTDDTTVEVFGLETGEPLLRARFADVERNDYPDRLRCTDPDDVYAFITSTPPGEDATPTEAAAIRAVVEARFERGGGVFEITKKVGLFRCRDPRSSA